MLYALVSAGLLLGATEARLKFGKLSSPRPQKELFDDVTAKDRTTTEDDYQQQWAQFLKDHDKTYLSQSQHDERYEIFKDNVDRINIHNAKKLSWWMKVTQFADLTTEEFGEQVVGGCTMAERENDDHLIKVDVEAETSLPSSVDWSLNPGVVTPPKNQGQCGSCWAFSTTGAVEAHYAIATGSLTSLSEQELVDCAAPEGNSGCEGGLMDFGFAYVVHHQGLCSESDFPYTARDEQYKCDEMRNSCTHYDKITTYADVQPYSVLGLELAVSQGPVSVAIEADQSDFQLYGGGVYTGNCGAKLDHGVLVVGYQNVGQKYWKVKNSWGRTWGMEGYILLCKECGMNGGAGQCGVLTQPSYPIV